MLNEIQTTTLRNRKMPIKKPTTKAGRQEVVHQEMHEFKHHTLHSGSKSGPVVKSRKQAVAIALSEAGMSKNKPQGAKQPHPKTNPGDYDSSPHEFTRSTPTGVAAGVGEATALDGEIHRGRETVPHRFPNSTGAPGAHGYGHAVHNRKGALRMSGHVGAHRIGSRGR